MNGTSPRVLAGLSAMALIAGCSASSTVATKPSAGTSPPNSSIVSRRLTAPRCAGGSSAAPASALAGVRTRMNSTPAQPFGVATTADGRFAFVATDAGVDVYAVHGLRLQFVRQIAVGGGGGLGEALSADGRYLVVGAQRGAAVIAVQSAENPNDSHAVLGYLRDSGQAQAIEVTLSANDEYAFLSDEGGGLVDVFDLRAAIASGFRDATQLAGIPVGGLVVGTALSPSGQWLFATSESGTLSVINVKLAVSGSADAIVAVAEAGCQPVRVALSDDGAIAWVTARGSDALLGFVVADLLRHPSEALTADVPVGLSPVGLAVLDNGRGVLVADSNRFSSAGGPRFLSLVDVPAALAGRPALVGQLATGTFPREMRLAAGGTVLFVTDYGSAEVQAIDVRTLPSLS